jgi:cobalt-zinc-cadmium efflux system membrane fusion protein
MKCRCVACIIGRGRSVSNIGASVANRNIAVTLGAVAIVALRLTGVIYSTGQLGGRLNVAGSDAKAQGSDTGTAKTTDLADGGLSVELNDKQMASVKVEPVGDYLFPVEKSAVGSIDFNEEMTVQVFTPYQGRIIDLFARVGDEVKKGQTLFTIDSPDLLNAESNLIAAAGVLDLTTRNLARLRKLYETRAVSQHDVEQATSDQMTAEGALRTGRDAVRIFGKTDAEIDQIVKESKADPTLVVPSPITGRVTARNAAPGLFVQPGNAPAPYSVADISTMWMLANVAESDVPAFRVGQAVKVSLLAFPGEIFDGRIVTTDSMVDPNTHRMMMRSEIKDPKHELRAGMFANFIIQTGDPVRSLALPLNGVVREGDGTMTVWAGELVASDGAIFLSFMVTIGQG